MGRRVDDHRASQPVLVVDTGGGQELRLASDAPGHVVGHEIQDGGDVSGAEPREQVRCDLLAVVHAAIMRPERGP